MSNKIFNFVSTLKILENKKMEVLKSKDQLNTNTLDRAGDIIEHDAWVKSGGLKTT